MTRTAAIISSLAFASLSWAADATPGYNTQIPEQIRTPDKVETHHGGPVHLIEMGADGILDHNLKLGQRIGFCMDGVPKRPSGVSAFRSLLDQENHFDVGHFNSNDRPDVTPTTTVGT